MLKLIFFLLITLFISTCVFAQQQDTSKVLIKFNEPMSHEGIFNLETMSFIVMKLLQLKYTKLEWFLVILLLFYILKDTFLNHPIR
jgi:hypothetical protein